VHKTEKEFVCSDCPMRFRHKNSLIRHMCQHTGERPYACDRCDSAFIAPHRLKEHIVRCHNKNVGEERKQHQEQDGHLDEASQALVADLMLEGCSDIILEEEEDDDVNDVEIEIIEEKKAVVKKSVVIQQQQQFFQPLMLQPTMQPLLMSLVAGINGQVYLVPQAQPPPQQPTIIMTSTPWPVTPPSSVSPVAILSPAMSVASPECSPELQQTLDLIQFSTPTPEPSEAPLLDISGRAEHFLDWESIDLGDKSNNKGCCSDIVASALVASDVLSEKEAASAFQCSACGRGCAAQDALDEHRRTCHLTTKLNGAEILSGQ
jgi:hypothetical protein